ncbi:MAG: MerR family transcriptional regulator [Bacteroidales bacterium]|jgi:DNA-binding transcriptional MerR regulator|nr:MerR family transcriptional regulator [Bacteroidales bacterium]
MKEDKFCYSIKEVSEELGLSYPTLRFWETQFRQIKPNKNKRGVRSYTKEVVEIIQTIAYLTRQQGYTLDGVKKYLDSNTKFQNIDKKAQVIQTLNEVKQALLNIKQGLEKQEQ